MNEVTKEFKDRARNKAVDDIIKSMEKDGAKVTGVQLVSILAIAHLAISGYEEELKKVS